MGSSFGANEDKVNWSEKIGRAPMKQQRNKESGHFDDVHAKIVRSRYNFVSTYINESK